MKSPTKPAGGAGRMRSFRLSDETMALIDAIAETYRSDAEVVASKTAVITIAVRELAARRLKKGR